MRIFMIKINIILLINIKILIFNRDLKIVYIKIKLNCVICQKYLTSLEY